VSRPPRFTYAGALHHVTLRCNNREFLFAPDSFAAFLDVLQRARRRFSLALYHYCLMTNHVHLLFEVRRDDTLPKAMHWLGTTFVREFNQAAERNGHLWEGRYRSTLVEDSTYFFRALAYVDLNPVRAGLVASPGDYPWSAHTALREEDGERLDFHPLYLDLGADPPARHRAYMTLLAQEAQRPPQSLATLYFVGSPRFVRRMEHKFAFDAARRSVQRLVLGPGISATAPRLGDTGRRL
jgi:putative transposase